jgi:hypothetical protein
MQDWAGWLLMIFSFSIVLMWKHIRSDTKLVHAIWFCLVLHHAVALLNAYVGGVIGAEMDARSFHDYAAKISLLDEHVWDSANVPYLVDATILPDMGSDVKDELMNAIDNTYTNCLGLFYRFIGTSILFGAELSVLAFVLSCVVLIKLVDLLDLRRFRVGIILLFGLMPSVVIFGSMTLRESWQALFFLLSVYWAIRLQKRSGILIFSLLLMSAFCLAVMHVGLSYYALYLIVISVYWVVSGCNKGILRARPVRFMFTGLLVACVIILEQKTGWFMTVGETLEGANKFRHDAATIHGRTTYGIMVDTSSVLGLVKSISTIFVYYMLAPFPWLIGNLIDIHAMLESMLRVVLLIFAVSTWRRSSGEVRSYYSFLLIVVLGMELMWALGTINWGTSIRHHMPGHSVVVLLGVPGLILFMRKLHFGIFGRRKVSGELNE